MANYIDYIYEGNFKDPSGILVWEQNYDTGEIEEIRYNIKDYLYFYADIINEDNVIEGLTSQRGSKIQKIKESSYKSFKDGVMAKEIHSMGLGLNTFESDIEPLQKVMLDNYGKDNQKAPKWNLALYDIETDVQTEDSFQKMRGEATAIINAVSVWYAKPNKFYEFAVVPPLLQSIWNYDKIEIRGNSEIHYYDNEKEMLEAFFEMNKKYETVALGAWNGDYFDTKYIYDRCMKIYKKKTVSATMKYVGNMMGRHDTIIRQKIMRGDKEEVLIRPRGMIWYDCLEAYKKNGPELESFALAAVAEHEGLDSKLEFEGNFETLYHGTRKDRARFEEITPLKHKSELIQQSEEVGKLFLNDEIYNDYMNKIKKDTKIIEAERETRVQIAITDALYGLLEDEEILEYLGDDLIDFERFLLLRRFKDTFNLFLDYSIQDTQILFDIEKKLKKFDTLSMLAQYNVSSFYDVFSTLKQVEQGITNFAHLNNKKVVIDRDYDKRLQPYNKYVDTDLLDIRINNDYKYRSDDSETVREYRVLASQPKIPGAHVLLPYTGLITFDEEITPKLAREFKQLKSEVAEIDALLAELEEGN